MTTIEITAADVMRMEAAVAQMDAALAIRRRKERLAAVILAATSIYNVLCSLLQRSLNTEED